MRRSTVFTCFAVLVAFAGLTNFLFGPKPDAPPKIVKNSENNTNISHVNTTNTIEKIVLPFNVDLEDFETLCGKKLSQMNRFPTNKEWSFFLKRFKRMDKEFREAIVSLRENLLERQPDIDLSKICNKKVDVYVGHILTLGLTGENGTPQGDVMQWADVILALYYMGVDVTVHANYAKRSEGKADQVWLDYYSARGVSAAIKTPKCQIRFIDAYGTQTDFNTHGNQPFCCLNLPSMKQYLTFTPDRAPENTFLGFAVPNENRFDEDEMHFDEEKTQGVIWGKNSGYFTNKTVDYLKALSQVMTLHSTVKDLKLTLPVTNHGFLPIEQVNELMENSQFFIGVDQPLFGHGALEAMMKGLIYINPIFSPPWDQKHPSLKGKPTNQIWTSQHPFLETLNEPWIINMNTNNRTEVLTKINRVKELMATDPEFYRTIKRGFIPTEYTSQSFVSRMYELTITAQYCT